VPVCAVWVDGDPLYIARSEHLRTQGSELASGQAAQSRQLRAVRCEQGPRRVLGCAGRDSDFTTFRKAHNASTRLVPTGRPGLYPSRQIAPSGGTMPKTGEHARESGEYTAGCAHWTIFMNAGWEFPPCPQCHGTVEYTRRSAAPVAGHEWGDVVSMSLRPSNRYHARRTASIGQAEAFALSRSHSLRQVVRHGLMRLHVTR
jgi:hypothetical protein